ncbi:MAG: NUDIX hydrolase [Candidatus Yanofskybacteria bacterium GW2011_GWA1_44_21]|uniref:Nudix hydrolase domain-containing protein n=2 Tax=Parcubacteria group TaxID=1794811 RepID=A0A1F8H0A4_9BACT|nr:MAG: NUDIX hydrolase [Candidatus Wolfebacteria bacterium GW2011_GWB1_41_12]KKT28373.1 MAG: NUDIX hydrolase [Candidatus Yanofskybacteria bacterium GW2011_GWA2_44_10]KKT50180.1 MAG: NUDIX hydrolase [Candidatus Yanofskybacteria bacterium GW2011_GWA1_44_21]OGN03521.1 MAG: hypothetical protein A2657_02450 [Candidatus Yanofskybacteria bacterium RIFCSPHIGHO2_01_FULL_44_110b]OGN14211.1 MAG: hypothetical protein A3C01_01275 [Candidatus Yanofskybacteria bacterium RIFCSPHIGHO2_02_FULL_44_36b]OGN18559.
MNDKLLSKEEFNDIYSKVPRLCVDLIVQTDKGIVLTLRKLSTWSNQWHFPGATLQYKERVEDAVKRIASDELGISVKIIEMLGYIEYPSEQAERGFGWTISIPVLCGTKDVNMRPNNNASDIKIFKEMPKNMIPEQKEFIENHLQFLKS